MPRITVGISGDAHAHAALDWAVDHALSTGAELDLVHVIDVGWGAAPPEFVEAAMLEAEQRLHGVAALTAQRHPGLQIRSRVVIGSPVGDLARSAEGSALLVIGSHRSGATAEHAASRRPARIATAAACSVAVIPDADHSGASGVIVGIDGSQASASAVAFAAAQADRFHEKLTVVYSWYAPEPWAAPSIAMVWPDEPSDEDRLVVAEATAGLAADYPDLVVTSEIVFDDPAHALLGRSSGARLLVVGSRGRHGLSKLLLGSVSDAVVWGLRSPVAVIR